MKESAIDWFAKQTGCQVASRVGVRMLGTDEESIPQPDGKVSFAGGDAETDPTHKSGHVDLDVTEADSSDSLFNYFMDGSRMAYKIAELNFDGKVWPVVAGQIGVACCRRKNRRMEHFARTYKTLLSVPRIVCDLSGNAASDRQKMAALLRGVNDIAARKCGARFMFNDIVVYSEKEDMSKENLAVARIQSTMTDTEKAAIKKLAEDGFISLDEDYLAKDGSLEYMDETSSTIRWTDLGTSLRYAVGVSKTFNAEKFQIKVKTEHRSAASFIANLKPGQRTQAFRYSARKDKPPFFAVWFVRIRAPKLGQSAFDGVLKAEVQLIGKEEQSGRSSFEINRISQSLYRERTPVCYGTDARWANHIYPVFVTERYLKSGFHPEAVFHAITL